MSKKLGNYVRRGLAGIVLGGAALTFSGCGNSYQEVFRHDLKKNMAPLTEPVRLDYDKHDMEHDYVVQGSRAYLRNDFKPHPTLDAIIEVPSYTKYRIPAINATAFADTENIEDANNVVVLYPCRLAAPDLSKKLTSYSKSMLNGIAVETDKNTLIFSGKGEAFGDFSNLTKLLNEFDLPDKQVRIRAKVVEYFWDNTYDRDIVFNAFKNATRILTLDLPSSPDITKRIVTGANINPFYNFKNKNYNLEAGVKFLDSHGYTRTLAEEDMQVANGSQVTFANQFDIPYEELLEGKTGFLRTVKYRKTGTSINVTPFANEEGFITIKLDSTSGEQTGFAGPEQNPVFREAHFTSDFTVRSGMPYLVGTSLGVRYKQVDRGVPLLNKIPIIGDLTSSDSIENFQSQLFYFLEARAMDRDSDVGILEPPRIEDVVPKYNSYNGLNAEPKIIRLNKESKVTPDISVEESIKKSKVNLLLK